VYSIIAKTSVTVCVCLFPQLFGKFAMQMENKRLLASSHMSIRQFVCPRGTIWFLSHKYLWNLSWRLLLISVSNSKFGWN